jgi:hypothetical protein
VALCSVFTGFCVAFKFLSLRFSEHVALQHLIRYLRKEDLVLLDRGFFSLRRSLADPLGPLGGSVWAAIWPANALERSFSCSGCRRFRGQTAQRARPGSILHAPQGWQGPEQVPARPFGGPVLGVHRVLCGFQVPQSPILGTRRVAPPDALSPQRRLGPPGPRLFFPTPRFGGSASRTRSS